MKYTAITAAIVLTIPVTVLAEEPRNPFDTIRDEINRVDDEDMRVKRGEVNNGIMTLRVEDEKKTRGRNEIYGRNVEIDVSDLDQSAETERNRRAAEFNRNTLNRHQTQINALVNDVRDLRAGVAAAVATASHQFDPGYNGLQMSLSAGYHESETAASVALGGAGSDRVFININSSHTSRDQETYGAGMTVRF